MIFVAGKTAFLVVLSFQTEDIREEMGIFYMYFIKNTVSLFHRFIRYFNLSAVVRKRRVPISIVQTNYLTNGMFFTIMNLL